jgi:hypothetical protein
MGKIRVIRKYGNEVLEEFEADEVRIKLMDIDWVRVELVEDGDVVMVKSYEVYEIRVVGNEVILD